jgi:hypothetical protein
MQTHGQHSSKCGIKWTLHHSIVSSPEEQKQQNTHALHCPLIPLPGCASASDSHHTEESNVSVIDITLLKATSSCSRTQEKIFCIILDTCYWYKRSHPVLVSHA